MKSTNQEIEKALKVINAVQYANSDLSELANFKLCNEYGMSCCVYEEFKKQFNSGYQSDNIQFVKK